MLRAIQEVSRRSLLPKWVRLFAWLFLVMGCATPALLVSGLFYPGAMEFSLFGWEHAGSAYDAYSLLVVAYFAASGAAAYGMLWGKRWGWAAGFAVGCVGLLLALGSMFVQPLMRESADEYVIGIRLEPFFQIPFLWVLWRVRRAWMAPAAEDVPARNRGLKVVGGLVFAASLVAAIATGVMSALTSAMVEVAGQFFASTRSGDLATARTFLSAAAQATTDESALRQFLVDAGVRGFESAEWPQRRIVGQSGELEGTVTSAGGRAAMVLTFVKEDGRWRIHHLSSPASSRDAADIRDLRKRAEADDATAQAQLGEMYYAGSGVERDGSEAEKWLRKAAERGVARAQFTLALVYDEGQGVQTDKAQAIKWYRSAADQGFAKAQFNLGYSYSHGDGVEQDLGEAVHWYRKAADQGFVAAEINLGNLYANGLGVAKDDSEAVAWYRKAAEQGSAEAQFRIGDAFAEGRGVERDEARAVEWYRKAADQGLAKARDKLAGMH